VYKALLFTQKEEVTATAEFVDIIDKFFDCLNVGNYKEGRDNRTAFKQPYRKITDFWLQVGCGFQIVHNSNIIYLFKVS